MSLLALKKLHDIKRSEDHRGILTAVDGLESFEVKRFYTIECFRNMWRGDHYHKSSTQQIIVLSGCLQVELSSPENNKGAIESMIMHPGDLYLQKPGIKFRFMSTTETSTLLVMCNTHHDSMDYFV